MVTVLDFHLKTKFSISWDLEKDVEIEDLSPGILETPEMRNLKLLRETALLYPVAAWYI